MNQHSRRGGQANGNGVDKARCGATRPAAVVAIVLCVGFAVAIAAIWQFGKPRSHQEMQTQPKAAVQTEIAKPETVQTENPEPETGSRVWEPNRAVPLQSSTAPPVSQANPAARPLKDGQVNSPTPAQEEQSHDFSHQLNAEANTFEAINPTTKVPGHMTAIVTGTFTGDRLGDGESPAGTHLQATQQATFTFVPDDRYSASYSATVKTLNVAGDTTNNSISLAFGLSTTGSDGSSLQFTLREVVTVTEDAATVIFEQLK